LQSFKLIALLFLKLLKSFMPQAY